MLKSLQRLALESPYIFVCNFFRDFLIDKCIGNFKSGSMSSSAFVKPSIFFSRNLWNEALVYKSCFFSEQPFYGNYSKLDSHTNTVISHAFAYSSRWRRKP